MRSIIVLFLTFLITLPSFAVNYEIIETSQTVKGKYKQKLEATLWKQDKSQQAIAVAEASRQYVDSFKDFQRWLKRQEAMQAFTSALAVGAQSMANQMQAQQLEAQRYQKLSDAQMKQNQNQNQMNAYLNSLPKSTYSYGSSNSNSKYPIVDPYADPNYWKARGY